MALFLTSLTLPLEMMLRHFGRALDANWINSTLSTRLVSSATGIKDLAGKLGFTAFTNHPISQIQDPNQ